MQLLKCNKSHFRNHKFADVSDTPAWHRSGCGGTLSSFFVSVILLPLTPSDLSFPLSPAEVLDAAKGPLLVLGLA